MDSVVNLGIDKLFQKSSSPDFLKKNPKLRDLRLGLNIKERGGGSLTDQRKGQVKRERIPVVLGECNLGSAELRILPQLLAGKLLIQAVIGWDLSVLRSLKKMKILTIDGLNALILMLNLAVFKLINWSRDFHSHLLLATSLWQAKTFSACG